jgi:hypothetical protein
MAQFYLAKLVFNINIGENNSPQFDEQLRLIEARNEQEAFMKARIFGVKEEDTFVNESSNAIKWQFVDVAYIKPIHEFKDGMEIQSQIHEHEEPHHYINFIQQMAKNLESKAVRAYEVMIP